MPISRSEARRLALQTMDDTDRLTDEDRQQERDMISKQDVERLVQAASEELSPTVQRLKVSPRIMVPCERTIHKQEAAHHYLADKG